MTGAAGFLGSHLCDSLLGQGHRVTGLDNFRTGYAENLELANTNPNFEFIEHDVQLPFSGSYDRIFHLASPASPPMYQLEPIETAKINFLGTLNALDLAHSTGARFLLASTSETYGDPAVHPQTEDYWGNVNQIGPRACYDEGKRISETLAFDFHRQHNVDIRVVRIFNTYGPRMNPNDGRVVSSFIDQAIYGRNITIFGNGQQTRSFCFYSDLVNGLMRMMETDGILGPINLGNPSEVTMLELAQQIIALTGSSAELEMQPLPIDDPKRRRPDITKAQKILGWNPTVSLRDGLAETIAYNAKAAGLNTLCETSATG
ncbi:MAG: UDP-glucuronic acid decarboxylase family protein [Litoreibacter sp.]|uniref:UDP-glucuronic acid decarboxylase family protein n=1 Tax=Litoreibacter sp. TaxID=1969459 RepID=UPI0032995E75